MIEQAMQNTKDQQGIIAQVALAVVTLLHQMQGEIDKAPEEAIWGKNGLVHSVIGMVSEVAWHLGYKVPKDKLKQMYEMVDEMMEQQGMPEQQMEPEEPMQQQPGLMGAMPGGM